MVIMKRISRQVDDVEHHNYSDPDAVLPEKKCKRTQKVRTICLLLAFVTVIAKKTSAWMAAPRTTTVPLSYVPPSNVTNQFLATFEKVMSSPDLILGGFSAYVPLILEDKKLLCRGSHKDVLSKARTRAYIEMLNKGLESSEDLIDDKSRSVPIILIESDESGCQNHIHLDQVPFPRLTWHVPSPKYGTGWCRAISMTGYESWNSFRYMHSYHDTWFFDYTWDARFTNNERKYPWKSKMGKAIWRGSTTGGDRLKHNITFDDLSRTKLVKKSMDRPDIIDAAFTSFVQGWEVVLDEGHSNQTIVSSHVPFDDLMKFRAIIDIDGNTWSSRFTKLLCTNSVVIKINPEYSEHFYADLEPMIHYVPASLQNITEVAEYVLDNNNQDEMRAIVRSANSWCKGFNTKEQLPKDAISQLMKYESALMEAYNESGWDEDWRIVQRRIRENIGEDLVDCNLV